MMPKIRLAQFREELLSLYTPTLRASRTRSKLRQVLLSVESLPGVRTTSDLTPQTVAAYVGSLTGCNPNTVNGYLGYLRRACNYAVAMHYLKVNPFAVHKFRLRGRPAKDRHLRAAEVARLLSHLATDAESWEGHRLYALVATLAFTGARRDEVLKLKVEDVRPAEKVIRLVDRSPLKTAGSAAPVPMPAALMEILAGWTPRTDSEWLFPGVRRRGPWTGGSIGSRPLDRAQAAAERCAIEGFTFAGLRQTWATQGESLWGLSELVIQRVLRHTRPRTQDHYRKADLDNLTAAVRGITFPAG